MNNFHNDDLLDMAKEKSQAEVNSQIARKSMRNTFHNNRLLAALGGWMVARGKKLQTRYDVSLQANQLEFSQGKAKKARA